jgi:hypothetical protein
LQFVHRSAVAGNSVDRIDQFRRDTLKAFNYPVFAIFGRGNIEQSAINALDQTFGNVR